MSDKPKRASDAGERPFDIALFLATVLISAGVSVVFVHHFLDSKPFKLMQPPWLPPLLAMVSVASAVGSAALTLTLLRRFQYAAPVVAVCSTLLAQILIPSLAFRIVIGGPGTGDIGWRAASNELLLEARHLLKPVALIAVVTSVIAAWWRRISPSD